MTTLFIDYADEIDPALIEQFVLGHNATSFVDGGDGTATAVFPTRANAEAVQIVWAQSPMIVSTSIQEGG